MKLPWMSEEPADEKHPVSLSRPPFFADYGSVIYSKKFRRLSNKTQVYLNPKADYLRTRLTHSIEAEQVARDLAGKITDLLNQDSLNSYKDSVYRCFRSDFVDLCAAATLAHDLGTPPFGHKAESVLNRCCKEKGTQFESNKQTLRLILGSPVSNSLGVTCALADAVMKYKDVGFFEKKSGAWFESEKDAAQRVLDKTRTGDAKRHPACYVMEAADDIAYLSADIGDALEAKILKREELAELIRTKCPDFPELWKEVFPEQIPFGDYLCDKPNSKRRPFSPQGLTADLIKCFIHHTSLGTEKAARKMALEELPESLHNWIDRNNLCKPENDRHRNFLYWSDTENGIGSQLSHLKKTFYGKYILPHPGVAQSEILAEKVISDLWYKFWPLVGKSGDELEKESVLFLFPEEYREKIRKLNEEIISDCKDPEGARIVSHFISGMTDRYAIDFWERLNLPARIGF